jgi:hypothetical protein
MAIERRGFLNLSGGWGQPHSTEVEIVGETPKRLRIKALTRTKLAGRQRWIEPGETALVPKYAVTDEPFKEKEVLPPWKVASGV